MFPWNSLAPLFAVLLTTLALGLPGAAFGVEIKPGDILVSLEDQIVRYDPVTGDKTVVSGGGVGSGPALYQPLVAMGPAGELYAGGSGGILRIDPASGDREYVIQESLEFGLGRFVVLSDGSIFADNYGWPPGFARIDSTTGTFSAVPWGNTPPLIWGLNMRLANSGGNNVFAATTVGIAVLVLNTDTGVRSVLSSTLSDNASGIELVGSGPGLDGPTLGLAYDPAANLIYAIGLFKVIGIDPMTGDRSLISAWGNNQLVGDGPGIFTTSSISVDAAGELITQSFRDLIRIDPSTGDRSIVTGFSQWVTSSYVVPTPIPEPSTLVLAGLASAGLAIYGGWRRGYCRSILRAFYSPWVALLVAALALSLPGAAFGVEIKPGDILVSLEDQIVRYDPVTGDKTVVSGGGVGSGPGLYQPRVGMGPSGELYASGPDGLIRVDTVTGNRQLVIANSLEFDLGQFTVLADGSLLTYLNPSSTFLRIDPTAGTFSPLPDEVNANPWLAGSDIFFANANASKVFIGANPHHVIYQLLPDSGVHSVVSSSWESISGGIGLVGDGPEIGVRINGFAFDPIANSIYAMDFDSLFRIDPATGDRSIVSAWGDNPVGEGPAMFKFVQGMSVEADGRLVVPGSFGDLFRVDPGTGNRSLIANFGRGLSGSYVVPTPIPEPSTFVLAGLGALGCSLFGYRRHLRSGR